MMRRREPVRESITSARAPGHASVWRKPCVGGPTGPLWKQRYRR